MTKSELIYEVSKTINLPAHEVERTITAAITAIKAELAKGDKVQLIGFGTFEVHDRAEHNARNPRTGEPMKIPAHKIPHFKPGKSLKKSVNGGDNHA